MVKKLVGAVVGFSILFGVGAFFYLLTHNKLSIGYNQGHAPEQPLPFSHKWHAGTLDVDCKYCHVAVTVGRHASVPSLNICMNCHLNISTKTDALDKLKETFNNGESVAWVKVHMLPDHVKFNHAAHIKAGKDCKECHGNVEAMDVLTQHSDLSMGWCVDCHRQQSPQAPINCSTCHY